MIYTGQNQGEKRRLSPRFFLRVVGGGCTQASGQSRSLEVVAYQSFNRSAGKPNFGVSIRGRAHTEV